MAGPIGGTFIYATWEHVDNDTEGFTYANDYQGQGPITSPAFGFYPHPSQALPVTRMFPILDNTQQVNQEVHDALGCPSSSLWCNYRLVGTQFQAINVDDPPPANPAFPVSPNDPTGLGQPLYLANLVIETNQGLQQFQGQPPLVEPNQSSQGKGVLPNNENAFARSNKYEVWTRKSAWAPGRSGRNSQPVTDLASFFCEAKLPAAGACPFSPIGISRTP